MADVARITAGSLAQQYRVEIGPVGNHAVGHACFEGFGQAQAVAAIQRQILGHDEYFGGMVGGKNEIGLVVGYGK